ncbi:MAG: SHOCT domain-containing protein [Thermoplasmata archaeon]
MSRPSEAGEAARILVWVLVALILALAVLGVIMSFAMGWTGFGMMGMGFGSMGFVMAIPAIVLVLILLVVLGAFDRTYEAQSAALEVLQLRLARGEISLEEYETLRTKLLR